MFDLAAFLRYSKLLTVDKPLDIVLTHLHFDHSGGTRGFPLRPCDTLFVHPLEREDFSDPLRTVPWITDSEISPKPNASWSARKYRVLPPLVSSPISGGHELDLGDRCFKVS